MSLDPVLVIIDQA